LTEQLIRGFASNIKKEGGDNIKDLVHETCQNRFKQHFVRRVWNSGGEMELKDQPQTLQNLSAKNLYRSFIRSLGMRKSYQKVTRSFVLPFAFKKRFGSYLKKLGIV
jgi:hypothetical protein